jgi:hypothetical protein
VQQQQQQQMISTVSEYVSVTAVAHLDPTPQEDRLNSFSEILCFAFASVVDVEAASIPVHKPPGLFARILIRMSDLLISLYWSYCVCGGAIS